MTDREVDEPFAPWCRSLTAESPAGVGWRSSPPPWNGLGCAASPVSAAIPGFSTLLTSKRSRRRLMRGSRGRAARLQSVGCHASRSFGITITYRTPEVSRRGAISPESTA